MSFKPFLWKGAFVCLLLPPCQALCSFSEFYEACDWKNKDFTARIIKDTYSFCPLDEKDPLSQCMVSDPVFPALLCSGKGALCGPSPVEEIEDLKNIVFREQILGSQIPKECFLASQMLGKNLWPAETNTYYYCHSSHSDRLLPKMEFEGCSKEEGGGSCSLKESQVPSKPLSRALPNRPPCLSPSYIHLVSRAFNQVTDCFGFTEKKDKARLFALLHHESRFLLNKVEEYNRGDEIVESTNRCFGQMKNTFIEELNKFIYFGDRNKKGSRESSWYPYGDIYQEAVGVCPFLKNVLTPKPAHLKGTALYPEDTFEKAHQTHSQSMMCRTSQDPYSCLFYSVFNAKVNLTNMLRSMRKEEKVILSEDGSRSGRSERVPKTLKPGEVLMVSGHTGREGLVPIRESVLDLSDISFSENISFKKVPLFKSEEELKWTFVLYAHNGGGGIITKRFLEFIQELKNKITHPDCQADPVCRGYRAAVLSGKGLETSVLYEEFAKYAVKHRITNHEELSQFMKKVHQDMAYLANFSGSLKRAALRLQPSRGRSLKRDNMDRFLNHIKKVCPTRL